jgi:hypothetical protein
MATKWTHTREALLRLQPGDAGKYLARLVIKGLTHEYAMTDDRFKIHMINYLRQTLPGSMEAVYEALLKDIMADKPQLHD